MSPPNSAALDGGLLGAVTNSLGEWGAMSGPNRAISTITTKMNSPMRDRHWCSVAPSSTFHWRWRITSCLTPPGSIGSSMVMAGVLIVPPPFAVAG